MKLFCQAIQTVTLEFCGVILVVGMLFGVPALGLRSLGVGEPTQKRITVAGTPAIPLALSATSGGQNGRNASADGPWHFSLVSHDR